jgi:hypothetical protein
VTRLGDRGAERFERLSGAVQRASLASFSELACDLSRSPRTDQQAITFQAMSERRCCSRVSLPEFDFQLAEQRFCLVQEWDACALQ